MVVGLVVGLASFFIFHAPEVYCVILGFGSCIMFFFIILWSSYVFVFH
jgi:hypothetical protein